jgi:hypothetical protein
MITVNPPAYSQKTQAMLDFGQQTFAKIVECSPETISDEHRTLVFAMFTAVVTQHYHAILILCQGQMTPASATALFRPLIESVIRAHWLWTNPSEDIIEAFLKDPKFEFGGFKKLAREVGERTDMLDFFQPFIDFYPNMCDYTHTGIGQVGRHFTAQNGVGPHQSDDWTRECVRESTKLALFHSILTCRFLGKPDGASILEEWSTHIPE